MNKNRKPETGQPETGQPETGQRAGGLTVDPAGWLSTAEAAALKQVTRKAIWQAVKDGRLTAWATGPRRPMMIDPKDLEQYEPTRPTGGPRGKKKP